MKKVILLCAIAACAAQVKAQQNLKSIYDSVKISQNIGKFKFDTLRVSIPSVQLQNLMAYNAISSPGAYKAYPDNMSVAVLSGDSKMSVAKLEGNDNMPVLKTGTNKEALIKMLKVKPTTKVPVALFPAPQK